eukprot:gene14394-biopygen3925
MCSWQASEMALPASTKTTPIELRVEIHHLRFAKMVHLYSQFDRSCLGTLWLASAPFNDGGNNISCGRVVTHVQGRFVPEEPTMH